MDGVQEPATSEESHTSRGIQETNLESSQQSPIKCFLPPASPHPGTVYNSSPSESWLPHLLSSAGGPRLRHPQCRQTSPQLFSRQAVLLHQLSSPFRTHPPAAECRAQYPDDTPQQSLPHHQTQWPLHAQRSPQAPWMQQIRRLPIYCVLWLKGTPVTARVFYVYFLLYNCSEFSVH